MNILDIIDKKEKNLNISKEEFQFAVDGFLSGEIKDYQMSSFLTEIDLLGLSSSEVFDLTDVMLNSGDRISFDFPVSDKHSTGGVGDKTTLVLAPLVASLGVKVAKMSGRGLGHTGGTIDKLEAIDGFRTKMSLDEFKNQVSKIGIALVGQMGNLVPADKKIYALRDVTGTVDSVPLIASSVMSKKIASGASNIVIDLKVGEGALVEDITSARELGHLMVDIGKHYDKKVVCVLTDMNEPLGFAIGNAVEVKEAIDTLKGHGPSDLVELVVKLGGIMVSLSLDVSLEEAYKMVSNNLNNGKAYAKFLEWIHAQGAFSDEVLISANSFEVLSLNSGYVMDIDALCLGKLARSLGAGRLTEDDVINPRVGIVLHKKVGDFCDASESLATVYYEDKNISSSSVLDCFVLGDEKRECVLIKEIIQ